MKHESKADRACRELLLSADLRALWENELVERGADAARPIREFSRALEARSTAELGEPHHWQGWPRD